MPRWAGYMYTVDPARQTAFHASITYNAHRMQLSVQHAIYLWVMKLAVITPAIIAVSSAGTSSDNIMLSMGQTWLVQLDQCSMTIAQLKLQLPG